MDAVKSGKIIRDARAERGLTQQALAVKSVIRESLRQRRRGILKWIAIALAAACAVAVCASYFFLFGGKAKQADIRAVTEIQEGRDEGLFD